jgi:hypothetical protein
MVLVILGLDIPIALSASSLSFFKPFGVRFVTPFPFSASFDFEFRGALAISSPSRDLFAATHAGKNENGNSAPESPSNQVKSVQNLLNKCRKVTSTAHFPPRLHRENGPKALQKGSFAPVSCTVFDSNASSLTKNRKITGNSARDFLSFVLRELLETAANARLDKPKRRGEGRHPALAFALSIVL